jgi:hypothetical protein
MHSVVSWISHSFEYAGDLVGWYKIISSTLTLFCLALTIHEVAKEIKHLVHGAKSDGVAKPESTTTGESPTPVISD